MLEIQGCTGYFGFIRTPRALLSGRSHPMGEVKIFWKAL